MWIPRSTVCSLEPHSIVVWNWTCWKYYNNRDISPSELSRVRLASAQIGTMPWLRSLATHMGRTGKWLHLPSGQNHPQRDQKIPPGDRVKSHNKNTVKTTHIWRARGHGGDTLVLVGSDLKRWQTGVVLLRSHVGSVHVSHVGALIPS